MRVPCPFEVSAGIFESSTRARPTAINKFYDADAFGCIIIFSLLSNKVWVGTGGAESSESAGLRAVFGGAGGAGRHNQRGALLHQRFTPFRVSSAYRRAQTFRGAFESGWSDSGSAGAALAGSLSLTR